MEFHSPHRSMETQTSTLRVVVVDENSGRMGPVTVPAAALKRAP
jgi:hypothetical protein